MADPLEDVEQLLVARSAGGDYPATWDRHHSIALSATKGLRNAPGENNCFVNCAVQVLWHLDVFRRSYRRLSGHSCMGHSCIFCALKVIFTQFQYSDKTSLHPEALRKALAQTFVNQRRFQLGHMDDAAECFENILRRLHFHIAGQYNEDVCNAPHCLPHQKFSMAVCEKVTCSCGASANPLKFTEMVHYVSASALVTQSRLTHDGGGRPDRFGLLLRKASAMGDVRNCPGNCGKQVQKQRTLLNIPDVVSVGLVWDSDRPSMETTTQVTATLGTTILLPDMYHSVTADPSRLPALHLVAVVCYYGKHYSTFVFHPKLNSWVYFDDSTVREIGPRWEDVVERCRRGRFQPLLLLYTNPNADPISTETAPQRRVMVSDCAQDTASEDGDRSQDSIQFFKMVPGKRSTTPTPGYHALQGQTGGQIPRSAAPSPAFSQDSGRDSPASVTRDHTRQPSFLFAIAKEKTRRGGEGSDVTPHLPGGASYTQHGRRPLLDGGASSNAIQEEREGLSSNVQYYRPVISGECRKQVAVPCSAVQCPDPQAKNRLNGKENAGSYAVRYRTDPREASGQSHREACPSQTGNRGSEACGHPGSVRGKGGSQHVVVKPTPTGQAGHSEAAYGRTPTTLPPPHSESHGSSSSLSQYSGPGHVTVYPGSKRHPHSHSDPPPLPPGTPPPEYESVLDFQPSHSRQTSTSSRASSMKSSVSLGNLHQIVGGKSLEVPKSQLTIHKDVRSEGSVKSAEGVLKKSESESDLAGEKNKQYIDPRMVESILQHQGLHRNNSSCSSSSSLDSEMLLNKLMSKKSTGMNLTIDIPFDSVSLSSQRDSAYGSSDRHSASSVGSGSTDPYSQSFSTKAPVASHYSQSSEQQQSLPKKIHSYGDQPSTSHQGQHDNSHKVMHPIKESSQEDAMRVSPNEPLGTQKFIMADTSSRKTELSRPHPVPPKNFAQFQIIKSSHSQSAGRAASQEKQSISGCQESRTQKDNSSKVVASLQPKHGSPPRESSLQNRAPTPNRETYLVASSFSVSNSNSSIYSESEPKPQTSAGRSPCTSPTDHTPGSHSNRQGTHGHTRPAADRQGPVVDGRNGHRDVSYGETTTSVTQARGQYPRGMDNRGGKCGPQVQPGHAFSGGSGDGGSGAADLYGTLPRNRSRRLNSGAPSTPEMYQSFLNKQKHLQAEVRTSQQSLDSVRSDTGSDHGSTCSSQQKLSKSELRQLVQDSIVQRQWHQPGAVQHKVTGMQLSGTHRSQSDHRSPRTECGQSGAQPTPGTQSTSVGQSSSVGQSLPGHRGVGQQQQQQQHLSHTQYASQQHRPPGSKHPLSVGRCAPSPTPVTNPSSVPPSLRHRAPSPCLSSVAPRATTPTQQVQGAVSDSRSCAAIPSHSKTDAGRPSSSQNVARVMPRTRGSDGSEASVPGSNYMVMMPPFSHKRYNPPESQLRQGSCSASVTLTSTSKPLERSASYWECQKLGESADRGASSLSSGCSKAGSLSVGQGVSTGVVLGPQ